MFKIKKLYFSGGSRRANTTHDTLLEKLFYLARSNSKIYVHIIYVLHVIFLTLSQNINPKQTLHILRTENYIILFSSLHFSFYDTCYDIICISPIYLGIVLYQCFIQRKIYNHNIYIYTHFHSFFFFTFVV